MKKIITGLIIVVGLISFSALSFAQTTYEVDPVDNKIGIITEPQVDKIDRVTIKKLRARKQEVNRHIDHLTAQKAKFVAKRTVLNDKIAALLAAGVNEPSE